MKEIKAVLFDYDDTLVQTMASKWEALKETGRRIYGIEVTDDHIRKFWGLPYEQMINGVLMEQDSFENLRTSYEGITTEYPMVAYPEAVSVINDLGNTYYIGIVTASGKRLVIDDLTMLNFPMEKFFYIQTSEDTCVHKPDPRVFDPILEKLAELGISEENVTYVGDGIRDFRAAKAAGLMFVGIAHGTTSREEFEKEGALVIDDLNQLLTLSI